MGTHQFFKMQALDGGIREDLPGHLIPDNAFVHIKNMEYDTTGVLKKRSGMSEYNGTAIANATSMDNGFRYYRNADASTTLIVSVNNATNNKVYKGNDATGVMTEITGGTALTTVLPIEFTNFRDFLFLTNGTQTIQNYSTGATKADNVYSDNNRKGKYICGADNRLWVAGDPSAKNTIYFSADGFWTTNPTTDCSFPTGNLINIYGDQNDHITGMIAFEDEVIVFRNNDVWMIVGQDATNYACVRMIKNAGALGQRAIAVTPDGILFAGKNNIYWWHPRGGNVSPVGDMVKTLFTDAASWGSMACGYYNRKRRIYCSYRKTAAYNDYSLIFDLAKGVWTGCDIGASAWVDFYVPGDTGNFYRLAPDTAGTPLGKIHRVDTGSQDVGTSFVWEAWTKYYPIESPELLKRFRGVHLEMNASTASTPASITTVFDQTRQILALNAYTVQGFNAWGSFVYGQAPYGGGNYQNVYVPGMHGGQGKQIQLRFTKTDANAFSLFGFSVEYQARGLRRI